MMVWRAAATPLGSPPEVRKRKPAKRIIKTMAMPIKVMATRKTLASKHSKPAMVATPSNSLPLSPIQLPVHSTPAWMGVGKEKVKMRANKNTESLRLMM